MMSSCDVRQIKVLTQMVAGLLPALHAHLLRLGCSVEMLGVRAFMCLFVGVLPLQVCGG